MKLVTFDAGRGYGHKHLHKSPELIPAVRLFNTAMLSCVFMCNNSLLLLKFLTVFRVLVLSACIVYGFSFFWRFYYFNIVFLLLKQRVRCL